jgi:hypothetical protein
MKQFVILCALPLLVACSSNGGRQGASYAGDSLQAGVTGTKRAVVAVGEGVGEVVSPVTRPVAEGVGMIASPVTNLVKPITKPIGDTASNVYGAGREALTREEAVAKSRANLARPVDCNYANSDIATLESERASTLRKVGAGVGSVLPISAAAKLLAGTYSDGVRVSAGQYNADIESKIAEIKTTCNVG